MNSIRDIAALWAERLPHHGGSYAEQVCQDWSEVPAPGYVDIQRTALVQARLAFTFLHAGLPAGKIALDAFNSIFLLPDNSGWIRAADSEGHPLDGSVDTYDQAFGLLALAWDRDHKGIPCAEAKHLALQVLNGLDQTWDVVHGGYWEVRPGKAGLLVPAEPSRLVPYSTFRRQNPHMHLFEAFLAWMAVDPSGPWRDRCLRITELLESRFLETEGSLREYFSEDWSPAPGAPGEILEPGHHFEWVWLLHRYEKITGDGRYNKVAEKLYRFGIDHGLDDDGLAWDSIDPQGKPLARTKLLWPQTELLKAHVAVFESTGEQNVKQSALMVEQAIRDHYFAGKDQPFYNQLDMNGIPMDIPTPSRVLYHLWMAFTEFERVV